jgi:hypothetical protein
MASAADRKSGRSETDRRELAELSALADGTLDPARRAEVEARIAASRELRVLYERERRVAGMLSDARSTTRAPAAVRARIEAERTRRRKILLRPAYVAALTAALAAVLLAVVLVSPAGTPGAPSVSDAAALASRGSFAPAPTPDPSAPSVVLGRNVEGVYFPNWSSTFGWRAVGQRVDHINGRLARTVYYQSHGRSIAYTIVAAPALAQPRALVSRLDDTELRTLTLNRRLVVTWRRAKHTCVVSASSAAPAARGLESSRTPARLVVLSLPSTSSAWTVARAFPVVGRSMSPSPHGDVDQPLG